MKRRGLTLIELTVSLSMMVMALMGFQMLFAAGIRSTFRTNASTVVNQENAQGIRRVVSNLNEAMSATITEGGKKITYTIPKKSTLPDLVTGEQEFVIPVEPDGVTRYFQVVNGKLVDHSGRVIVRDIVLTDLEPTSSQYNQPYAPFQFTTIGGTRAISINFVTAQNVGTGRRYAKMKSTVLLRNAQ